MSGKYSSNLQIEGNVFYYKAFAAADNRNLESSGVPATQNNTKISTISETSENVITSVSGVNTNQDIPNAENTKLEYNTPKSSHTMVKDSGVKQEMNQDDYLRHYLEQQSQQQAEIRQVLRENSERMHDENTRIRLEIQGNIQHSMDTIHAEISELQRNIKTETKDMKDEISSLRAWVVPMCIATILSIAGIVVAVFLYAP